jgi:hypothetical protein
MPPRSYVITAVVLAVLVAVSIPLTLGFFIIVWYWLFAAAACILAVVGVFKIANGLRAPLWLGIALALPGFVWASDRLYQTFSTETLLISKLGLEIYGAFNVAAAIALAVAAVGALRLVEIMSRPDPDFRFGYGALAAAALLLGVGLLVQATGWDFAKTGSFIASMRAVVVASTIAAYGLFIGAAVQITRRRDVERWTGAAISLVSAYMIFKIISSAFSTNPFDQGDGLMFWLEPVAMLVGGAAVWRMGTVLRAQALLERPAQS